MADSSPPSFRFIQVFSRYLQPGGEEKSVARIAEDLESGGHRVTRFWRESAEWQGPAGPPKWRQPFLLWHNAAVLKALETLHAEARPDAWLVHNILPVISLDVYQLAGRLKVPVIQWLHNYRPLSPSGTLFAGKSRLAAEDPRLVFKEIRAGAWHGPLATAWLAWGYARLKRRGDFESVRAWVAISEEMKRAFARAGWFPDRLHALRHAWHTTAPPAIPRDDGYFLFLGRLVEAKGVRFLVDLWRHPALKDIPLIVAGQGDLLEALRQRAPPNVRWAGQVEGETKRDLLAGCRAVLAPGLWDEPLGLVAYEAYEVQKPVLASNLGGLREVVQDGTTGRLLAPAAEAAWREAILELDPSRARQLGLAGRRWLEQNTAPSSWNERFRAIAHQSLAVR